MFSDQEPSQTGISQNNQPLFSQQDVQNPKLFKKTGNNQNPQIVLQSRTVPSNILQDSFNDATSPPTDSSLSQQSFSTVSGNNQLPNIPKQSPGISNQPSLYQTSTAKTLHFQPFIVQTSVPGPQTMGNQLQSLGQSQQPLGQQNLMQTVFSNQQPSNTGIQYSNQYNVQSQGYQNSQSLKNYGNNQQPQNFGQSQTLSSNGNPSVLGNTLPQQKSLPIAYQNNQLPNIPIQDQRFSNQRSMYQTPEAKASNSRPYGIQSSGPGPQNMGNQPQFQGNTMGQNFNQFQGSKTQDIRTTEELNQNNLDSQQNQKQNFQTHLASSFRPIQITDNSKQNQNTFEMNTFPDVQTNPIKMLPPNYYNDYGSYDKTNLPNKGILQSLLTQNSNGQRKMLGTTAR